MRSDYDMIADKLKLAYTKIAPTHHEQGILHKQSITRIIGVKYSFLLATLLYILTMPK